MIARRRQGVVIALLSLVVASTVACGSESEDSSGSESELNGKVPRATCEWAMHCQEYVGELLAPSSTKACTEEGEKHTPGGRCPGGWTARCIGFTVAGETINDYYYQSNVDPFEKELCEGTKSAVWEQK